jgi:hypothetical protein
MFERWTSQSLRKHVTQLILRINLQDIHSVSMYMLAKPVIFDGVMLRARGHSSGFELRQGKCTDVILVDIDVHVSHTLNFNPN